jgi:hypothetical protein
MHVCTLHRWSIIDSCWRPEEAEHFVWSSTVLCRSRVPHGLCHGLCVPTKHRRACIPDGGSTTVLVDASRLVDVCESGTLPVKVSNSLASLFCCRCCCCVCTILSNYRHTEHEWHSITPAKSSVLFTLPLRIGFSNFGVAVGFADAKHQNYAP